MKHLTRWATVTTAWLATLLASLASSPAAYAKVTPPDPAGGASTVQAPATVEYVQVAGGGHTLLWVVAILAAATAAALLTGMLVARRFHGSQLHATAH